METHTHTHITEADVVAWLTERAKEHAEEFGGYGFAEVGVLLHSTGEAQPNCNVGAGGLCLQHRGATLEAARQSARKESKPDIAAKKREQAARLLREAEELEAKS